MTKPTKRQELMRQARSLEARIEDHCTMYTSEQWFAFKIANGLSDRQLTRMLKDAGVYFEPDW